MSMSKTLSYGTDILFISIYFKKKKKNSFVNDWIGYIYGMAI